MGKKTPENPYGLTGKQLLAMEDMARKIKKGEPIDPVGSTEKFYEAGSKNMARVITSTNLHNTNFRAALIDELHKEGMIGPNSVVGEKLMEGLEAEGKDGPDYKTRLAYIQEIHKVIGVYAPQKVEKKSLTMNVDVSEEELDEKIKKLQEELK